MGTALNQSAPRGAVQNIDLNKLAVRCRSPSRVSEL